jgi:hypothetical protein
MAKKPISLEDFASWRDNTITQQVFAHLKDMQGVIETRWIELLHAEVPADPRPMQLTQVELKAKLEFIADMLTIELSDIQEEAEAENAGSTTALERPRARRA